VPSTGVGGDEGRGHGRSTRPKAEPWWRWHRPQETVAVGILRSIPGADCPDRHQAGIRTENENIRGGLFVDQATTRVRRIGGRSGIPPRREEHTATRVWPCVSAGAPTRTCWQSACVGPSTLPDPPVGTTDVDLGGQPATNAGAGCPGADRDVVVSGSTSTPAPPHRPDDRSRGGVITNCGSELTRPTAIGRPQMEGAVGCAPRWNSVDNWHARFRSSRRTAKPPPLRAHPTATVPRESNTEVTICPESVQRSRSALAHSSLVLQRRVGGASISTARAHSSGSATARKNSRRVLLCNHGGMSITSTQRCRWDLFR